MSAPDASDRDVERKISEWESGVAPGYLLHEYLGWTPEQLRRWYEDRRPARSE
jgi:hypothetical protein